MTYGPPEQTDVELGDILKGMNAPKRIPPGVVEDADELQARISAMVRDAVNFNEHELAPFRIEATKYYKGELFGNEQKGRSSVVITSVREAVQALLPDIMEVFVGPEGAVEYAPASAKPEAVIEADAITAAINYIFMTQNNGAKKLYQALKDAMVRRRGVLMAWHDETPQVLSARYTGLTPEQLQGKMTEEGCELVGAVEQAADGTVSATFRKRHVKGRLRVDLVPVDELIYNRSAREPDEAILIGRVMKKTVAELVELGYDPADIDEARHYGAAPDTEEEAARQPELDRDGDESTSGENAPVTYAELYVRMDFSALEGSEPLGRELRRVCCIGEQFKVMATYPETEHPFAMFVIDPEPAEMEGLCPADDTMDLQQIESNVARGLLDSLNLTLNPRTGFVEGMVNLQDLMNPEVGGLVRMRQPGMLQPLEHRFVGADGMLMLDYFERKKETRLGIQKGAAGINSDALQSSTRTAVGAIVSASQARKKLIARMLAETGLKDLFGKLYRLAKRHPGAVAQVINHRGRYVQIDPSTWPEECEVVVKVGIGGGLREEKLAVLEGIAAKQEQIMTTLGPDNVLLDQANYRYTLGELVKLAGRPDVDRFFKPLDPEQLAQQNQQAAEMAQQQQESDPAARLAAAQIQIDQQRLQMEGQKMQAEMQFKQLELQFRQAEAEQKARLEAERIASENAVRMRELELKYNVELTLGQMRAEMEREKTAMGVQADVVKSERQLDAQREAAAMKADVEVEKAHINAKAKKDKPSTGSAE